MHPAHLTRPTLALLLALGVFLGSPATTLAQEGVYAEGAVFADIRQFGSTSIALPGDLSSDLSLDATGVGGSIRVGTWLNRRWTIEAGLDLTSEATVGLRNPFILALFPPGQQPLDLEASSSFMSVTTMVGYHQRAGDDVRFGYLAGFSFLRASYRTELEGLIRRDAIFATSLIPNLPILPFRLEDSMFSRKQNHGALALGFEAAIEIADDLDLVPEIRAFAFSRSDSTVFLIRPGAAVRWTF